MKNFIKTISFMVVTVLLLSSILPVSIYATSLTNGGETDSSVVGAKTGPEDVTIQVTNEQALYSSVTDKMKIPIKIDASLIYDELYASITIGILTMWFPIGSNVSESITSSVAPLNGSLFASCIVISSGPVFAPTTALLFSPPVVTDDA